MNGECAVQIAPCNSSCFIKYMYLLADSVYVQSVFFVPVLLCTSTRANELLQQWWAAFMPGATFIYLQDRKQIVDTSGYYSKAAATNIGGTQEFILGPVIFLNCINDSPTSLSSLKCIPYADDMMIFSSNHCISMLTNTLRSMLNEDLLKIYTWYEHKLQMSHNKTNFIIHPFVCATNGWILIFRFINVTPHSMFFDTIVFRFVPYLNPISLCHY